MFHVFLKKRKELLAKKEEKTWFRLPKSIVLSQYIVCFKINMKKLNFDASVAINMEITEECKSILLHAIDLFPTKTMWEELPSLNRQEPMDVLTMENRGQLDLKFEPLLIPQTGQLRLNYRGPISDSKMHGMFKLKTKPEEPDSPEKPETDEEFNLIAFFQPTDARRCLPCYDDPCSKTEFDICLIIPKGYTVLGNTIIKARYNHKRQAALEIVEFKRTPKMPTYSVAFAVGIFDCCEGRTYDDIPINVYTLPGKSEQAQSAITIAKEVIPFFTRYFMCDFPLQKLDILAVPDFPIRSAEGWGLIMCHESRIFLTAPTDASITDRMDVALAVCEDMTKQWIGNLVSMEWWNQYWIQCGLGLFLRYVCLEEIRAEFQASYHMITEVIHRGMAADGLKSTRPLDSMIHTPVECDELPDDICFKKGAAIFRMLYNFIGEETFKEGLRLYLDRHQFQTATPDDLWTCFDEVSKKAVIPIMMRNWASQKGFPVVKVAGKQDGRNRVIKVVQEKFCTDQTGRDPRAEGLWVIPLTIATEGDPSKVAFETVFDTRSTTIVIPDVAKNHWVKLNPGIAGFYRVKYLSEMFNAIARAIKDKSLPPVDRINIMDDQFAMLLSGVGNTVDVLTLMEAYIEDEEYCVWITISKIFNKLLQVFAYINLTESVKHFGRFIFSRILENVGFVFHAFDGLHLKLLRSLVISMMVKFGQPEALTHLRQLYEDVENGVQSNIEPELQSVIYYHDLSKNEEDSVKLYLKTFRDTTSAQDRRRIAKAFSAVSNPNFINLILEFAMDPEIMKSDAVVLILAVAKSKVGREVTWNFFKEHHATFKARYGSVLGSKLVKGIIEGFASEERVQEIREFFSANSFPGTEKAQVLGVDSIRVNEGWLKREKNTSALKDYLDAEVQ